MPISWNTFLIAYVRKSEFIHMGIMNSMTIIADLLTDESARSMASG